ncbi:hypothetical protein AXK56_16430 [Tsukamurella pulmonis]|nr:hypothetical protein AXK56_16430 [Tsukamurella pulmonis]
MGAPPSLADAMRPHVDALLKLNTTREVSKTFGRPLLEEINDLVESSEALTIFEADVQRGLKEVLTQDRVDDAVVDAITDLLYPPEPPELAFPDLGAFVEGYVVRVYRREVEFGTAHIWCPSWFEHEPLVVAMQCLWSAFETYRRDPGIGPLVFHRDGLLPIMNAYTHPDGPLKGCSVLEGHLPDKMLKPLPCNPIPEDLFKPTPAEMAGMPTAPPELPNTPLLTGASDE